MTETVLSNFASVETATGATLSCRVTIDGQDQQLTYDIASGDGHITPPAAADWAVVGMLYPTLIRGGTLKVEAPVTDSLMFAIKHDLRSLMYKWRTQLKPIEVQCAETWVATGKTPRAATGFSGGVDTFATLKMHGDGDSPHPITDLTLFDTGAFGRKGTEAEQQLFGLAGMRLKDYAAATGKNWLTVATNLNSFFDGLHQSSFQRTHNFRNASAALALQDMIGNYYYSSSHTYAEIKVGNWHDIGRIDVLLFKLLSNDGFDISSTGSGYHRLQKTEMIADMADAFDRLDVCIGPAEKRVQTRNCSTCEKCRRTMLTLDVLGKLQNFAGSFDLDLYKKHREETVRNLAILAATGSPMNQRLYARIKGTELDADLRFSDRLNYLKTNLKRKLKAR